MKKLKKVMLALILLVLTQFIFATSINAVWVNGYYRSDGTYVRGHYRSSPNGLKYDNYSWSWGSDLYNDSYYDYGRSYKWRTPSWNWQNDYWRGLNSYRSYNNYDGYWSSFTYDRDYDFGGSLDFDFGW